MTTRGDIETAKAAYYDHIRHHPGCRDSECPERSEAWGRWMGTAGDWGKRSPDPSEPSEPALPPRRRGGGRQVRKPLARSASQL